MTTPSDFDRLTTLTSLGEGRYAADLPPDWVVAGAVNGGFQMALIGKALKAEFPNKPDPITVSGLYLSAGAPGPAEVRVEVKREGGSLSAAAVEIWQGEDLRLATLAQVGDLARINATAWGEPFSRATPPDLPPREQCISTRLAPPEAKAFAPFLQQFEMLIHPKQVGWALGKPSMNGEISAWFRIEGSEPSPALLLMALDSLPAVTVDFGMYNWAPTLELTCHIRRRPVAGWLRLVHRTRLIEGGLFEEDCEIWDESDHLVAQARQLVRQPRPA